MSNYIFEKGDIVDSVFLESLFTKYNFDGVIHLAAESHVDRSITNPMEFIMTNIVGTVNLLNAAKKSWKGNEQTKLFYHISTDEVYGSLAEEGLFVETTPYDPQSPYSSSKASSDHFVRSYGNTFGLPFVISNCSNNYGPNQFPEKLLPLFINNIRNEKSLPVYGDGKFTRDWLYVVDHAVAIDKIYHEGRIGQTYNIGGFNEWANIDLIKVLCRQMDIALGKKAGNSEDLITFVKDRPGHDKRYAIDAHKLKNELGWEPSLQFEEGLAKTIQWYLNNKKWMDNITSGDYKSYYKEQYS
jgi:dTDP-glucose 4,6-dehydratase